MNTGEKNTKGRTIFRGPRGGEYVLNGTRKIRSFKKAAAPAPVVAAHSGPGNTGKKNTKGRTIYRGPRGGEYVLSGTKKIRKFTRAPAAPPPPAGTEQSPARMGSQTPAWLAWQRLWRLPGADTRRSSPELLANMMNQIYIGGRDRNINAGRYTNAEKNVLARRITLLIKLFKRERDAKKMEAMQHRAILQAPGLTNTQKQTHRNQAAAANERVGYYDDSVRAYTRGLRAVKPLTGAVTPRARAIPATPNRYTPAPANVENNAIYMPLNRPHLVVKTPGAGTIYLNPNTLTGFLKNSARVTVAPANLRDWLRMARRDFPNEALFRHPLAAKNVTASHIRFSRG